MIIKRVPKTEINILGTKFRTLYGLCQDLRAFSNQPGEKKITQRKLGEYIAAGMPHGFYLGQYIFSEEKKKEIILWIANRTCNNLQDEIARREKFYGHLAS